MDLEIMRIIRACLGVVEGCEWGTSGRREKDQKQNTIQKDTNVLGHFFVWFYVCLFCFIVEVFSYKKQRWEIVKKITKEW